MRLSACGALAVSVAVVAGCTEVQDFGPTNASTSQDGLARGVPPPGVTLEGCPLDPPTSGAACSVRTGFCNYHTSDAVQDRWCTCTVDQRWSCFSARNPRSSLPVEQLPLETIACTEGAPCTGDVTCSVGTGRTCRCTSSGRLLCQSLVAK